MHRQRVSQGSAFEQDIGYSRAVVEGNTIHISGTTGFDYGTMSISEDVAEQTEKCLENIDWALKQAGASFGDIVRVRYILQKASDFPTCWPVLRAWFGTIRPAATMFAAGLADPRMKIEIEATAVRRDGV